MNGKYTRKQISEAIAYWSRVLNESAGNDLVAMAQNMSPDMAKLAELVQRDALDEGAGKAVATIGALMLAACMLHKIAVNAQQACAGSGGDAVSAIGAKLEQIEKNIDGIRKVIDADIAEKAKSAKSYFSSEAKRKQQLFDRIMNEKPSGGSWPGAEPSKTDWPGVNVKSADWPGK